MPSTSSSIDSTPNTTTRGRYELGQELARGGMGVVFRAFDRVAGREVAYKRLLLPPGEARAKFTTLFEREYYALAQLRHPNIVEVHDYGIDDVGMPYYVMELLTGENLFGTLSLSVPRICEILYEVASALALVHARRLVHRDVTPKNVIIEPARRTKLVDFGALTPFGKAREIVGTAPFTAPECVLDGPLDGRADLFSLGALAYSLLTGRRAIAANSMAERLRDLQPAVEPLSRYRSDLPEELEALVLGLLNPDPLARPATAADVMQCLSTVVDLPQLEPRDVAYSYLAHPPLIGRAQILERASDLLRTSIDGGNTQVFLVEGAHGTGRSALLDRIAIEGSLGRGLRAAGPWRRTVPLVRGRAIVDPRGRSGPPAERRRHRAHQPPTPVVPDDPTAALSP